MDNIVQLIKEDLRNEYADEQQRLKAITDFFEHDVPWAGFKKDSQPRIPGCKTTWSVTGSDGDFIAGLYTSEYKKDAFGAALKKPQLDIHIVLARTLRGGSVKPFAINLDAANRARWEDAKAVILQRRESVVKDGALARAKK